jgi:hypothetical protein
MRQTIVTVMLALLLVSGAGRPAAAEGYGEQAGWGLATATANLLYIPAKLAYATVGAVTGGLAYVLTLGNTRAVQAIWSPALGGSYVLTPGMIRGQEPILFFGESADLD